jgi:hypothetical protein
VGIPASAGQLGPRAVARRHDAIAVQEGLCGRDGYRPQGGPRDTLRTLPIQGPFGRDAFVVETAIKGGLDTVGQAWRERSGDWPSYRNGDKKCFAFSHGPRTINPEREITMSRARIAAVGKSAALLLLKDVLDKLGIAIGDAGEFSLIDRTRMLHPRDKADGAQKLEAVLAIHCAYYR